MQEENKYENILYAKNDKVATITLNRQKSLNALNTALLTELRDALEDAETDAAVHVRSDEPTSEIQSLAYLVCRLLREKKKPQLQI